MICNTPEHCERLVPGSGNRPDRSSATAAPAEQGFAQQIAAFYPYARDPGNAPAKSLSGAGAERSRATAMQSGSGLMRRRQARDE